MRTGGTLAILAAAVALTLSGCAAEQPDPIETLPPETIEMLNDESLDCLDGDNAACNRLRAVARAEAPGTNYERIGATCGERLDEPLEYGTYCEVP